MYALNHSLPIAANLKISTSILHYFLNIFEIGGRLDWPPVKTRVDPEMLSGTNPELDAINRQVRGSVYFNGILYIDTTIIS